MNGVLETIRNRRSVRQFSPEQITNKELDAILEAGIWAPSGHNAQPWHFLVVRDKKKIDEMSRHTVDLMSLSNTEWIRKLAAKEGYHLFHRAPTVIIVSGVKTDDVLLPPLADCSAAIENMLLAAESMNIGTCWVGLTKFLFDIPEEIEELGIPKEFHPLYSVCVGYKMDAYIPSAPHRKEGRIAYYAAE